MLASITPLGERGRHNHWTITVLAFLAGGATAGAVEGALLGAAGALLLPGSGEAVRLVVLAAALLAAIGLDWRGAVPGPRRQVNERWLHQYRGWVYGVGYGTQLGIGVSTVVSSGATYVALLAAFLTAGPAGGALIVGVYGAIRGLTPLLAAGVHTPGQLLALHARLGRARVRAARGGLALLTISMLLAFAGGLA
jgi:hypothetical protein